MVEQIGALIIGLGIAIIFHEVAHGWVAYKLGDPTAFYAGRLSLNPAKHIDPFGTIVFPILLLLVSGFNFTFGWAKPVPVNYYNLRAGRYGPTLVALAGPATNLIILILFALLVRVVPANTSLPLLFLTIAQVNGILMLFNLIPVPPLDGSKILYLFLERRPDIVQFLERYGTFILLAVIVFGRGFLDTVVFFPAITLVRIFAGV